MWLSAACGEWEVLDGECHRNVKTKEGKERKNLRRADQKLHLELFTGSLRFEKNATRGRMSLTD